MSPKTAASWSASVMVAREAPRAVHAEVASAYDSKSVEIVKHDVPERVPVEQE